MEHKYPFFQTTRVRQWPLGPNGFWYERTGRDDIVIHLLGATARASRDVTCQYIKAVREAIRKGDKIRNERLGV